MIEDIYFVFFGLRSTFSNIPTYFYFALFVFIKLFIMIEFNKTGETLTVYFKFRPEMCGQATDKAVECKPNPT